MPARFAVREGMRLDDIAKNGKAAAAKLAARKAARAAREPHHRGLGRPGPLPDRRQP